jgi:transcriptional regulator with XRE-family HTH domain
MSMETTSVGVPEFDRADRMRKALRVSGVGVQEIADYLGVARNTVSTWINGRIEPSTQTVRLWALKTGVPYEWLQTGRVDTPEPPDPATRRYSPRYGTARNFPTTRLVDCVTSPAGAAARHTGPGRAVPDAA